MVAARRVWSEMVPYRRLREATVLGLARRFSLELLVAVQPHQWPELRDVVAAFRDAGVSLVLWPMLSNDAGRWASADNMAVFCESAVRMLDAAGDAVEHVREVAVDLEPAIQNVARWFSRERRDLRPQGSAHGRNTLAGSRESLIALQRALRSRGIAMSAAAIPLVALDPPGRDGWQRVMATPVDGIDWNHVTLMTYTSMVAGFSRGVLRREDSVALHAAFARAGRARFGPNIAGISLGAVGVGALGNEPTYRACDELAQDVAVARACGIATLTLFDFGGVLRRESPEAWLTAFTETPALAGDVPHTLRSNVVFSAARACAKLAAR